MSDDAQTWPSYGQVSSRAAGPNTPRAVTHKV